MSRERKEPIPLPRVWELEEGAVGIYTGAGGKKTGGP
jgi:hypothetical protein